MIKYNRMFEGEVQNYINSHPAFAGNCCFDRNFWYDKFEQTAVKVCKDETHPFHKIMSSIFNRYKRCRPWSMKEIVPFVKWIEPYYCEYRKINTTGFFKG